jgi:hypothetical protein
MAIKIAIAMERWWPPAARPKINWNFWQHCPGAVTIVRHHRPSPSSGEFAFGDMRSVELKDDRQLESTGAGLEDVDGEFHDDR